MNIQTRFCALKWLYKYFNDLQKDPTNSNRTIKYIKNLKSLIQSEMKEMKSQALKDGINLKSYSFTGKDWGYYCSNDDYISNLWKDYVEIKDKKYSQFFSSHIINCIHELENKYFTNTEWILPTSTLVIVNKQFRYIFGDPYIIEDFFKSNPVNDQSIVVLINKLMTVDDILESWKDFNNVQHRYPILKEALEAHNEGNFFLSVSTLIPQVEGVIRDIIEKYTNITNMKKISDCDGLSNDDIYRAIKSLEIIWKQKDINNIGNILSPLLEMLKNLYKDDRTIPNNDDNDGLYRKGICHGGRTNFGIAKNSLKLILILDRLIFSFIF
jgi:hypothetical protein